MSKKNATQITRCLRSLVLIGVCIALLLIADSVSPQKTESSKAFAESGSDTTGSALFPSDANSLAKDPESALENPESLIFGMFSSLAHTTQCSYGAPPEAFEEELVSCSECGVDAFLVAEGLVGFECSGNKEEAYSKLDGLLSARGWSRVETDADQGGFTYVKDEGRYRWLFLSCSEVSGSVSVWMAYQVVEEEGE